MENPIPLHCRITVTVQQAAAFTGVSRSRLYELIADGTLEGVNIRGRRLVKVRSLLRLLGENDQAAPNGERAA